MKSDKYLILKVPYTSNCNTCKFTKDQCSAITGHVPDYSVCNSRPCYCPLEEHFNYEDMKTISLLEYLRNHI